MHSLTTFSTDNYKNVSYDQALQVLMNNPWHSARDKRRLRRLVIKDIIGKISRIFQAYNNHIGQRTSSFEIQCLEDYNILREWRHKFLNVAFKSAEPNILIFIFDM
jgi:hypothetical protein